MSNKHEVIIDYTHPTHHQIPAFHAQLQAEFTWTELHAFSAMNFWGFVWSSETVEDKAEAPVEVEAENIAVAFLGPQGV